MNQLFSPPTTSDPSKDISPWHWGWSAVLAAIVLVTLAFRYALPVRDGDLWFHMLYGKYFLEHKTLIADHTIFSWTPTTNDTIYCTWLPDIFLYLLYKATKLPGLFAFRYLCLLTLILSCFYYARRLKIASHPLVWLIALIALLMSYTAAFLKPEIFSFCYMNLVVWNWWHIRSGGEKTWRHCYLFPIIMLVWTNSHGAFFFGAIFLVLIWFGELLNTWLSPQNVLPLKTRKHLTLSLLIASITPFLTPYGYKYPLQLMHDLLPTKENMAYNLKVTAYLSPFTEITPFQDFTILADLSILILIFLYVMNFRRQKVEWSSLLTNMVFAFLYTRFFRTTFYWAPIFALSSIQLLATTRPFRPYLNTLLVRNTFAGVTLIATLFLSGDSLKRSLCTPEGYLWMGFGKGLFNPVAEAEYIKKYFPKSRIGNSYNQGAYLLWELWPENRVFFDSRHFPYKEWSEDFFAFMNGTNMELVVQKYPCDIWCLDLRKINPIIYLKNTLGWNLAFYGRNSAVLVRPDLPLPAGAPKISPDILDLKNTYTALNILTFACVIRDWEMADNLLGAIKDTFKYKNQLLLPRLAEYFIAGMKSYYNKNYLAAIKELEPIYASNSYIPNILSNCYHFLADEAWQQEKDALAMEYTRKAWAMTEDNIYSIYNGGIISWWEWVKATDHLRDSPDVGKNSEQVWYHHLQLFLQTTSSYPEFKPYQATARAILDGHIQTRPQLLMPPEPPEDDLLTKQESK